MTDNELFAKFYHKNNFVRVRDPLGTILWETSNNLQYEINNDRSIFVSAIDNSIQGFGWIRGEI